MLLKINEDIWNQFKQAMQNVSAPVSAHQTIANIMQQIETQCRADEEHLPESN